MKRLLITKTDILITNIVSVGEILMDKELLSRIPNDRDIYVLVDCGAYLVSYLKYRLVTFNKTNITPFIKILELYMRISSRNPKAKFLFFIDNGVSQKLKTLYKSYKSNRQHSIRRRSDAFISSNPSKSNDYVVNRTLICKFFINLAHGVFYYSEADYQLGLVLNKLMNEYNVPAQDLFVVSHDNDMMSLIEYANCIHKLPRTKKNKEEFKVYAMYDAGDYEAYLSDIRVANYEEYIIMKSLRGDTIDNIMRPIMIEDKFVKALFNKYKYDFGYATLNLEKTFEIIKNKVLKKVKDSTEYNSIEERLAFELRRNYIIFDIFNSKPLFTNEELNYIETTLKSLMLGGLSINLNESKAVLRRVSQSHLEIFERFLSNTRR